MEHQFITYIRTKMLFQQRLRHLSNNNVFIHECDLQRFNVSKELLFHFEQTKQIQRENNLFRVLNSGNVDLSLLKKQGTKLTPLHEWMRDILNMVILPDRINAPVYFDTFLKCRDKYMSLFFIVDEFCGRVHTPVSSLKHELRPFLILCNEKTISLDVSQMQPTLLANILLQNVGENSFSNAINEGVDVYVMLQNKAQLKSREEAKKRFFQILFGKPNKELEQLFDGENWIKWINDYKIINEPRNPHGKEKPYSNLAWLLQNYEVFIMSKVWRSLAENAIPFLSVHDEIICRQSDIEKVKTIFSTELSKHFKSYKINIK